jgi:hypothetical protein
MAFGRYKLATELKKAAKGKKTAVPVGILLIQATEGYPHIQRRVARAFSISGDGCPTK